MSPLSVLRMSCMVMLDISFAIRSTQVTISGLWASVVYPLTHNVSYASGRIAGNTLRLCGSARV